MQGSRKTQLLLISGAIALTVLLYIAPKKLTTAEPAKQAEEKETFNFNELLAYQQKNLSPEELQKTESWLSALKESVSRTNLDLYDSLATIWDQKKMPALSANYFEMKAEKDQTEKSYLNASYRFFDAYKQAIDSTTRGVMVDKAIRNYSKVLELNPKNLDAKTDLGILYAEATREPMKGIVMLREVVAENPNHENAQLNLGLLSVKSNQFEKAIERFDKVLEINPSRLEIHIYKGQLYSQLGDKVNAIESFVTFKQLSNNTEMIQQVDHYIADLKKIK